MLERLEELARQLGLRVRSERGDFRSGWCRAHGEEMIILNRRLSDGERAAALARLLGEHDLEGVYLLPDVRRALDEAAGRETAADDGAEPEAGAADEGTGTAGGPRAGEGESA